MTVITDDMIWKLTCEVARQVADIETDIDSILDEARGLNVDLARLRLDISNVATVLDGQDRRIEWIADRLETMELM